MILKKVSLSYLTNRISFIMGVPLVTQNKKLAQRQLFNQSVLPFNHLQSYSFSSSGDKKIPLSQTKITFQIQRATSAQQLRQILSMYSNSLNLIHRTVLLQKATQRPFDQDEQLVQQVISSIKNNWKYDYAEPTQSNSRAIANTICYMSRKKKLHHLDQEFSQIDYFQLAKHVNPKQFVMTLNGLLKLQLTQKIQCLTSQQNSLQKFITQSIHQQFFPSLLVSMWFNLIKFQKTNKNINNFFANLLKNKHFKNNMIDYMQIVYCYVNSEGQRTVDLTYPLMTHPKELNQKSYIGAHQLSVLYEQLVKVQKIKDIYFSDQFSQLLETCYLKILNQKDVPLRNIANVFNNLAQYQNPTSKTLQATYQKYYTVLKGQISVLQKSKGGKRPRTNVDPLSFVTLFNQLLQFYQTQNNYLNQLANISLTYLQKVINHSIISEYNERTFVRLLNAIELAKKMIEQRKQGQPLRLNDYTKFGLEKQIMKRQFNEVAHLGKLIGFVYNLDIRSSEICHKLKKLISSIPKENQTFSNYQERLKQKCILNKNCKNCQNCFSNF